LPCDQEPSAIATAFNLRLPEASLKNNGIGAAANPVPPPLVADQGLIFALPVIFHQHDK
jgi:hypothetical protein